MFGAAAATMRLAPWHVSIGVRQNRGPVLTPLEGHRGGGTLICGRWVLTAAHSLSEISDLLAADGSLRLSADVSLRVTAGITLRRPARDVAVTRVRIHPQFDPVTLQFDAALLELASELPDAAFVSPHAPAPGTCGIVAGWGETQTLDPVPDLRWACLHVTPDAACEQQVWRSLRGDARLMFAAGGDSGPCPLFPAAAIGRGDSGAGFVVYESGLPAVYGIASWSAGRPTNSPTPQVFTRTCTIAGWIAREVGATMENAAAASV